jgi:hypothetical protein
MLPSSRYITNYAVSEALQDLGIVQKIERLQFGCVCSQSVPCFCYVIQITYAYTVRIATHAQSDALESSAGAFVSQRRLMRVTVAPGAPPHEGA